MRNFFSSLSTNCQLDRRLHRLGHVVLLVLCLMMNYMANLGDSRVVLDQKVSIGGKPRVVAERLSRDHNVSYEEVRKEVEAQHPGDSPVVVYIHGVWTIKGIIQVSRSIGDFNDMFQGIAKRLVAAAIREATKKRELRYKDIMKGVSGGISMMTFL